MARVTLGQAALVDQACARGNDQMIGIFRLHNRHSCTLWASAPQGSNASINAADEALITCFHAWGD
jgi:hypothetical protein